MSRSQIARNIAVHDRIARKYERRHDEIFNPREQARLGAVLADAKAAIASERARSRTSGERSTAITCRAQRAASTVR